MLESVSHITHIEEAGAFDWLLATMSDLTPCATLKRRLASGLIYKRKSSKLALIHHKLH